MKKVLKEELLISVFFFLNQVFESREHHTCDTQDTELTRLPEQMASQ
jgi:hypothetical protein